ncbi:transglycosylase domain-containing protein [Patescibacteria group bacterium]
MVKRRFSRKIFQKNNGRFFLIIRYLGIFFFLGLMGTTFLFLVYAKDLPRPERFTEKQFSQSTKIYDRTGQVLLYEIYGEEKRTLISLDEVPSFLKDAIVSAEDSSFYSHFGIDFSGLIRSVFNNFRIGSLLYSGGSTIPQQLIRSTFLTPEKTISRKTKELVLALELDRQYSKDQILEWYVNQIPFGQNSYGVEAASQTYFNKSVSQVTLAESAILTSLIQAPSYLSPYGNHKDELLERKDYVLNRMVATKSITKNEAESAKKEIVEFAKILQPIKAPHFTLWVKNYLEENYGENVLMEKGLKIYTSLDWPLQEEAERIIKEGVELNKLSSAHNASLVAIDPKTGEILVMVGSADYFGDIYPPDCISGITCSFDPKFNIAVGTKSNPGRQPGSSFKPFVYVTAFENGFNSSTTLVDEETNFGVWGNEEYIPKNYDETFHGEVTLRQALAQSLNIPSIKVLALAGNNAKVLSQLNTNDFTGKENIFLDGLANSIETAKKVGISTLSESLSAYGPALVLGGGEVKLLDMVSAYGVFATEGMRVPPVSILKIEDSQGNIFEENKKTPQRVLEINACRILNNILSDNEARIPVFNPYSSLYFPNNQVAAKTGTTQDYRDAWVIGYTPSLVVGAWAGNNNNSPINKQAGAMIAGPMFHKFMEKALLNYPRETFVGPQEIATSSSF